MELTNAAVHARIADLNALATELRIARETHPTADRVRPADRHPVRPSGRLGDWLIGLGTALGGRPVDAGRPAVR